jgi:hypothetical protein
VRLVSALALGAGQTKSPPAWFASAGFFDLFALAVSTSRKSPRTRSSRDDDEHDDDVSGSACLVKTLTSSPFRVNRFLPGHSGAGAKMIHSDK